MNMKRVTAVLGAALLTTAMALPALAQNNPPPADSAHNATAAGASNDGSKDGSAANTRPKRQHVAQTRNKKKKQSFSKRMHDKAEKILSAIKQ